MNKPYKLLAFAMITLMTFNALPAFAIGPPDESHSGTMWIEPSTLAFTTGSTSLPHMFNVTVWLNASQNGFTWEVFVNYDTSMLNVTRAGHTNSLVPNTYDWLAQRSPDGDSTYQAVTLTGPIYSLGSVDVGGTCMGDDYVPADTAGCLVWVEFNMTALPDKGDTLDSYITLTGSYVLNPGLATITTTLNQAHYTYAWTEPPHPSLTVDPTSRTYGPYPPSAVGTLFPEDVKILGLDTNWHILNATLDLQYNSTLLNATSVSFNPLWLTNNAILTVSPGNVHLFVEDPSSNPPTGDVLIATVTFNLTFQDSCVPIGTRPIGAEDDSPLHIANAVMWADPIPLPISSTTDGLIRIFCLILLPLPHFEVSSVTMGPGPALGQFFNVTVSIKNLDSHWYLIGAQFRLTYDPSLFEPVGVVYEGPFLPYWAAQQPGATPPGTWYVFYPWENSYYGPNSLYGDMILPNSTGWWNPPWPDGEGVIATITYKVNYQSFGEADITSWLNITDQLAVGIDDPAVQNIVSIPLDPPVNGIYTITTNLPGRMIDLYGGAMNKGYGCIPFPAPYGGQGLRNPMDLVVDQAEVGFYANVTYNYWPVQHKMVGFEVMEPDGQTVLLKQTALTDENGVAYIHFQMPWPCENPELLFGVWKVTATVSISDVLINDTLQFHYDYMTRIWKVTTDKYQYNHGETVVVTIEYGSHAQQLYPLLLTAVMLDELRVPFFGTTVQTIIGGAQFCQYKNGTATLYIYIPKYAFAGIATIHVNAYDKDPTVGGTAWCPEYAPAPTIAIQPY